MPWQVCTEGFWVVIAGTRAVLQCIVGNLGWQDPITKDYGQCRGHAAGGYGQSLLAGLFCRALWVIASTRAVLQFIVDNLN